MQNKYIIAVALTAFTQTTSWGANWDETIENITASDWRATQDSSNPSKQLIDTWVAAATRGDKNEIERLMPIVLATAISNQDAFENIPPEIFAQMIESLDERSLQQIAQVNRSFREAVDRQITPQARRERITQYNKELFDAIDAYDVEQVKRALSKGANPNAKLNSGVTTLMQTANLNFSSTSSTRNDPIAAKKQLEIVQILLDHGANINRRVNGGPPPLVYSIVSHNVGLAHMLINNGADLSTRDSDGDTALIYAAGFHDHPGMESIIDKLIEKGANIDEDIQQLQDRNHSRKLNNVEKKGLNFLLSIKR